MQSYSQSLGAAVKKTWFCMEAAILLPAIYSLTEQNESTSKLLVIKEVVRKFFRKK